jgi:hypothetical protein
MPRFAYLAPTFGAARRIAWDYVKKYCGNIPGTSFNEADLRVNFPNGGTITLLSAENPGSLRGIYLDGVILDEFAEMDPTVWTQVIRPTLSDRSGWAIFIGTPKGANTFFELYEYATTASDSEWFGAKYRASETGLLSEAELASAKRTMAEEEYAQEYEADFNAGLTGAYFSKEMSLVEKEERITDVPHNPGLPVDTYWDLGVGDATSVWFVQSVNGKHNIIDYYETTGGSIPDILRDIRGKQYNYGRFVFPHDVEARDFSTGRTRLQTFYSLGVRNTHVVPKIGSKRESIHAARIIFAKCWFDKKKCERGIKCLINYQRRFDAKNNVYADAPLHNWASNGADAFQQFAMGSRSDSKASTLFLDREDVYSAKELSADMSYDPFGGR